MKRLSKGVVSFFHRQHYVIVTTIDSEGHAHNSCKGIVDIDGRGMVYLLDLYTGKTYENLKENPNINITAVNEHKFTGYSLKGKAMLVKRKKLDSGVVKLWEDKITKRLSHRLIKNIKGEKGHPRHPEALLPRPECLIEAHVEKIIDLTPHHIRHGI